jgi:hypothetical protein
MRAPPIRFALVAGARPIVAQATAERGDYEYRRSRIRWLLRAGVPIEPAVGDRRYVSETVIGQFRQDVL